MRNLILTLDSTGYPNNWMSWQDAVLLKCKGLIAWEFGDEEYTFRGGISRMTGEQSHVEVSSIIALKSKFKYEKRTPVFSNRNLFRRDLHTCAYCIKTFGDAELTKDHIHPESRGGATSWMNCVTACKKCNGKKDNRTPEEANMLLAYVPYVPDRAEALVLQNRNILADQMKFLLNFIPKHSRVWASV